MVASFIALVILLGLVLGMIVLLRLQLRSSTQMNKLSYPAYEYVVRQAEHKAEEIVEEAQKEARKIIALSQETGQKTIQEYTQSATEAHTIYVETVEEFTHKLVDELSRSAAASTAQAKELVDSALAQLHTEQESLHGQFVSAFEALHTLQEDMKTGSGQAISEMKQELTSVREAITEKLHSEESSYRKYIDAHLEKVTNVAEEEIKQYRQKRMDLLDAHIENLVEDITMRVLQKQLTLSEHAELATQALKDAKEHNLL